jgi:hypothetical protein
MIVLAYPTAGWTCWLFTSFYLESRIWSAAISRWIRHWNSIKFCANLGKKCDGDSGSVQRGARGRKHEPSIGVWMACPNSPRPDKARQVTSKAKSTAHHYLWHQGDCSVKNPSWQRKQSIAQTTVTFCGDWVKMCEDFDPNTGDKRIDCCITATYRLTLPFSPRNIWPKTTWLYPPPTLLFYVSSIEEKTERGLLRGWRWPVGP